MKKIPWIGTSWKMNKTRAEARVFATILEASPFASTPHAQPFVIPPFPYIAEVADILKGTKVKIGAQNMHWADQGAWTGEVSPLMVKDCGAAMASWRTLAAVGFVEQGRERVIVVVVFALFEAGQDRQRVDRAPGR